MRVLWFTNVPVAALSKRLGVGQTGVGGHWISELLDALADSADLEVAVATAFPGIQDTTFTEGRVTHFAIGQPRRFPTFAEREMDLRKCADIVKQWHPDLVHIHGSERFYGLIKARHLIAEPVIISLQGLLEPYSRYRNYFGSLTPWQIVKATRALEVMARLGLLWNYLDIKRGATRESQILESVRAFMGRTRWDRASVWARNETALYRHVGEVLRRPFYDATWSIDACQRHRIIFTNAGHPRRGVEVLLEAVQILRKEFPDVSLGLAGSVSPRSGYGRRLRGLIGEAGLTGCVDLLGYLNAEQMVAQLEQSHVFVIASYIENSPNSLAEAMMVGMPCVASYVGGIPDMVTDGETGIHFPAGDAALLADSIKRIFIDGQFASRLGQTARKEAAERHAPPRVVGQLLAAYRDVLSASQGKQASPTSSNKNG